MSDTAKAIHNYLDLVGGKDYSERTAEEIDDIVAQEEFRRDAEKEDKMLNDIEHNEREWRK